MISQNQVKKQYSKLLSDVQTLDYYQYLDLTNKVNNYICGCGRITKTRDIDAGCTPMMIMCECGNMAMSTGYKDCIPAQPPTFEWYRPTLKQVLKMRKNEGQLDHILRGGLEQRPCARISLTEF